MRKTNYTSLETMGSIAENATPQPDANVSNRKTSFVLKWFLALFILAFSFSANAQISLTASGGTTSGSYTTLKAAFDAINAGTHTGAIAISVNGNTTETASAVLNFSGSGTASFTSVSIKPTVTATISGNINGALVKLNCSDNVTIDGSTTVGGTTRDLTFLNLWDNGTFTLQAVAGIWLGSLTGNGATGNTIKNCIVSGSNRTQTYAAIVSCSGSAISSTGIAANSNNTYTNNLLKRASNGLALLGFGSSPYDAGTTVNNNNIDSAMAAGITLSNQSSYNVYGNIIDKQSNYAASIVTVAGITTSNNHLNGNIYNNKILYVRQNSTSSGTARGISLGASGSTNTINVYNNFVNDVSCYGVANSLGVLGIAIISGGGYNIYYNTVYLVTDPTVGSAFPIPFYCQTAITAGGNNIQNNIFAANLTNDGLTQIKAYAFYHNVSSSTFQQFTTFKNNCFYTNHPTLAFCARTGGPGALGTIAAIQAEFTGLHANSVNVLPSFASNTNTHLTTTSANASLNNSGLPVSGITTDIDGDLRSSYFPDMGADEIVYTPKIASFSPANACAGSTVTINGADLNAAGTTVSLAGAAASATLTSTSTITASVAGGYTSPSTGVVSVTNSNGTGSSSTNITRLAPGTYTSKTLSTGSVGDQVTIAGSNLTSASAVTFSGTPATYTITNSTEAVVTVPSIANGTYTITITDACGNAVNAGSFTVVTANPCVTPAAQATNFVQSSLSSSVLNGTFSAASGSPSGYVVVYGTSGLSSVPADGTTYTAGAGFGGTIQQVSSSTSVNLTGLVGNTTYTVTVFAYNGGGCSGGPLYNTTSPLTYTFTTCGGVPTNVTATPVVVSNQNNINLSWAIPSGGSINALTYEIDVTSDAGFTQHVGGSPFSTNQLSVSATNLNFATKYYYRIRSNNGCYSSYVSNNITTGCGSGTILPYTENFDGVVTPALPNCWTFEDYNGDGKTWFTSVPFISTGHSTPTVLRYNVNTATGGTTIAADDWAFTPGFQLTGGVSYTLSFLEAAYSNGENLQVRWGTSAASSAMPVGNTIWSGSGISNQTFAGQYGSFTPTNSGVYYFGFYTNSPSSVNGGLYLYIDNIKLQVTPGAPAAQTGLTASNITSNSVDLAWTDNANNEDGYYVYTSTDGTNWDLVKTISVANTTSTTVSNLASSTAYYFKVTPYNFGGGEGSGATTTATTLACSSYTTNTWIGALTTTTMNWGVAGNWSLGHQPTTCEDVVISPIMAIANSTNTATTAFIGLNNNTAVHNLTISPTDTGIAAKNLYIYSDVYDLFIGGNLTIASNRTNNTSVTADYALLAAGLGNIRVNGTADVGVTGNRQARTGSDGSGSSNYIFKGDVTFGPQAGFNAGSAINYVFDAAGSQTVKMNSTLTGGSTFGMGTVTIGSSNAPNVSWNDTITGSVSQVSRVVNDLTIGAGASLTLTAGSGLNRTVSGGTFTMGAGSTLTVTDATGGVGSSNFPSNFGTHTFNNSSTVVYNGSAAQTIASAPAYGNLTVNNASGATINGNTTVNNTLTLTNGVVATGANALTIGLSGSVVGASSSKYVNGTLAKTIGSATSSANYEIGDATNYTPVSVAFAGSTNSGGVISAKTTAGMPAALGYLRSGVSQSNYLNRTYKLSNAGVTGFTAITPTFNYVSGDLVGTSSNSGYYIADSVYGGGWSIRTTSNPTATTSSAALSLASGASADYLIGELDPPPAPVVNEPSPSATCEGSSYVVTGSNFYGVTGVTINGAAASYTVNSSTQITIAIPVGATTGVIAVSNSTGTTSTSSSLTINAQPQTTVTPSSQTVCSGTAISTIVFGNTSNISGTTYSWTRTGNNAAISGATTGTANISGSFVSTSTIPETVTYNVTSSANGCTGTVATATVIVKASPGDVTVTGSGSICQNSTQQLVATVAAATGSSVKNSGAIAVIIPDNNFAGSSTTMNINDVPAGAVITGIDVNLNLNMTYNGDLSLNLTAPNGKTLNLVNKEGGAGVNFTNTLVSSASSNSFPGQGVDSSNMTETWAADLAQGVGPVAFSSNALTWSQLFSTPNGNWRLSGRDYGAGDEATITNWSLTIYYTLSPTFVWAPTAGLYTDAGFTPYTGGNQKTVYVKNTPGSYSYNANISFNGCTASSNTASVNIQAIPSAASSITSQTVCSGTAISDILLSSPNDGTAILTWTRDHTSDVTGTIGNSGTGNISGNLVNTTAAPITVTFTITANGSGSQSCAGTSVTATVTVNPTPLATAAPASQNACSGTAITPITLGTTNGVSGTNYTWTRDNTSAATGIAASGNSFISGVLTNASGVTTVTFSVTAVGPGVSACAGTPATATVTIYNAASVYNVTGGGSYCSSPGTGVPVGLSNSQTGYTYQLLLNGSPVASVGGTGSALSFGNQFSAGTYTVLAQNAGCSTPMNGSATVTVITTVTPTISLVASSTTACAGTNVSFFAVSTNGGTNPTYNFLVNGISKQSGASNAYVTNSLQNGDIVSCILSSFNTCQTSSTTTSNEITVTINSGATLAAPAAIAGTTTQCTVGASNYLKDATSGGTWSSSNPSVATINSIGYVTSLSNGITVISYSITGSNGCKNSSSVVYTVAEQTPVPAITGLTKVCVGSTITLSNTISGGVWSSANNAATVNASSGVVTGTFGATNYTAVINYKVTNAAGCSKSTSYNVTVNPKPAIPTIQYAGGTANPQTGAGGGFCINKTFTIIGTPAGGAWSSTNSSVVSIGSSTGVVNTLALGTATITYTYTNANSCSNSRSVSGSVVNCPGGRGVDYVAPKQEVDFTLYPNPAKGSVAITTQLVENGGQIIVTDIFGKRVRVQALSLGTNNIDISNLSKGLYLVNVITNDGTKVKKLVIE